MGYAVRKDGQGWRAVNKAEDIDAANENFSETQPVKSEAELLKENTNASIRAQIAALEAEITIRLQCDLAVRPNAVISRPNSAVKTPKKPIDFIADIDSQIAALRTTLIP